MARPKGTLEVKIKPEDITRFAKTGATIEDIANRLGTSKSTLERRLTMKKYREALMAGRGELNISLRAKQISVALEGNVQMLIWLGENYLGQARSHRIVDQEGKDRPIIDVSPVEVLNTRIAGILERRRTGGDTEGLLTGTDPRTELHVARIRSES